MTIWGIAARPAWNDQGDLRRHRHDPAEPPPDAADPAEATVEYPESVAGQPGQDQPEAIQEPGRQPDGETLARWGSYGYGLGQFSSPSGIAVGARGNVYVSDRRGHRIQWLTADGTTAKEGTS